MAGIVWQALGSGDGVDGGVVEGAAREGQVHGAVQSLPILPSVRGPGRKPGASDTRGSVSLLSPRSLFSFT